MIEDTGWLDEPANVKRLFVGFIGFVIGHLRFSFSLGWHKHAAFGEESLHKLKLPAFMGFMGL